MRNTTIINFLILFLIPLALFGQTFEKSGDLSVIKKGDGSNVSISSKYYKDGEKSLLWDWDKNQSKIILLDNKIANSVKQFENRAGIKVWIFNEDKSSTPLVFNFRDNKGNTKYTFNFNMNFTGWRAAWLAYSDMWTPNGGETSPQNIVDLEIISPQNIKTGKVWLDRLEFANYVDRQATPDAQIPENNRHLTRDIWHWGLLHAWAQYEYDIEVPATITNEQSKYLKEIVSTLDDSFKMRSLSNTEEKNLSALKNKLKINSDGTQGAPLMQKDNMIAGDVNYGDLNDYLYLTARKWLNNNDNTSKEDFVKGIRYMLNQGFAYESGMGTNHHYGYQIRNIFWPIYEMQDILKAEGIWEETRKTVIYWSGLTETRKPFREGRDELADSWNTLLIPRLVCALMADTEQEQFRNMEALARWVNGSVAFSPGTIGGIKIDGTGFHHGGHYPAYASLGYGSIGQYLKYVNGTPFTLKDQYRDNFKFALLSLARQTNKKNWGVGVSGRHPFSGGEISYEVITAFGYAAKSFDPIDEELAGQYLRLIENNKKRYTDALYLEKELKSKGFTKATAPQGFYVYNHACQGIYRYNDIMISLKGFSRNIWGAEIYSSNNRFGRYQSYGSAQIIGTPDEKGIVTELASGYKENGWDWNRNPGTTTIHLLLDNLNSPFRVNTLRQPNSFSGASDLENGKYGMFATKLGEMDALDFTPSFKAYKSVFCFGDKVIFLGSEISNDNNSNPTETTLFQQYLNSENEEISVNDASISQFPYDTSINEVAIIKDTKGYYYYIPKNQNLVIKKQHQQSIDDRITKYTNGNFAVAYLNHGNAPKKDSYEYMILLTPPTDSQIKELKKGNTGYKIKRKDNSIHIVEDVSSKARGYAVFEPYTSTDDDYVLKSDEEIMIMLLPKDESLSFSVCSPDLNIGEYSYTSSNKSQPVQKQITLKGKYKLKENNSNVAVNYDNKGNTVLTVTCKDGIPVKFDLVKSKSDNSTPGEPAPEFKITSAALRVGEFINVEIKGIEGKKTLKLFDAKGTLVKEIEIKDEVSKISTEGLSAGVYRYEFMSDKLNKKGEITIIEEAQNGVKVYPTLLKSGEPLFLEMNGLSGEKQFIIYDANGALIKGAKIKNNEEIVQFPTHGLVRGVYFYQLSTPTDIKQQGKFIIK